MNHLIISILLFSFYSCNDDPSKCECFENYYDIKRGKYDNTEEKNERKYREKMSDKTKSTVKYYVLDKEDKKIRDKCIGLYNNTQIKNSKKNGECD